MATIANDAVKVKGFWGLPGNVQPELRKAFEDASETFTVGRFLEDQGNGSLQLRATDNNGDIVGIAAIAGQNNAAAATVKVIYYPMVPWLLLEINMLEAADAAHVSAQTDLWVGYQYQATSTFETIDTATTTPRLQVVEIELEPTSTYGVIGDSNIRVHAVPRGSLCAISPDV